MQRNVLSRDCDSCLHSPFSWWDEGCFEVKVQVWFLGSLECFTSRLLWSPTSLALHPAVEYLAGPGGCLGSPVGLLGFAQHKEFLVAFNTQIHVVPFLLLIAVEEVRDGEILEYSSSSLYGFCFRALQNLVCDEHKGHRNTGILGIEGILSVGWSQPDNPHCKAPRDMRRKGLV